MAKKFGGIFKGRKGTICLKWFENQKEEIEEYWTIRGAISWPRPDIPGYYLLMGLKYEAALNDRYSLHLIEEGEVMLLAKFVEKVVLRSNSLLCERLFADLREKNKSHENFIDDFVRKERIPGINLYDSSEFDDLERGVLLVKQWKYNNVLVIPEETILKRQLQTITSEDLKADQFYAVRTLIRIIAGFEAYPWKNPLLEMIAEKQDKHYDPLWFGLETE